MKDYLNTLKNLYYKLEILTEEKENNKNKIKKLEGENKGLEIRISDCDINIDLLNDLVSSLELIKKKLPKRKKIMLLVFITSIIVSISSLVSFGVQVFSLITLFLSILNVFISTRYSDLESALKENDIEKIKAQILENETDKEKLMEHKLKNLNEIELYKTVIENVDLDINELLQNVSKLEPLFSKYAKEVLKQDENKIILSSVINSEISSNEKKKVYMKK